MVTMRKGNMVGSSQHVVYEQHQDGNTSRMAVASIDMSSCQMGGCWHSSYCCTSVTHHHQVIRCCSLCKCVRFVFNKQTAVLLCKRTMPQNNAPPQWTDGHRSTVVREKKSPPLGKAEAGWIRAPPEVELHQKERTPPDGYFTILCTFI